jgi:hypothetical protein
MLILTGDERSVIHPAIGRVMRLLIPNATLHVFHDGHRDLVRNAHVLAPLVEVFLGDC